MTPNEYGNGNSLAHDRMQADVLDWLREHGLKVRTIQHDGAGINLHRHGPWAEVSLKVKGTIRGFVDILERWSSDGAKDARGHPVRKTQYIAYEIKPRITTVGGLVRQMRAEADLIEQAFSENHFDDRVVVIPVINHDDPELPLLRRLWPGAVAIWNAEERTLA